MPKIKNAPRRTTTKYLLAPAEPDEDKLLELADMKHAAQMADLEEDDDGTV